MNRNTFRCMNLKFIFQAALILIPVLSEASALVVKDDRKGVVSLIAQINYRGHALTPQNAYLTTREISRMWNESGARVSIGGRTYRTRFILSYTVNDLLHEYYDNGSCAENRVDIEAMSNPGDRSFYSLFGRRGTFYTSDELGYSTTAAHEFGHGLGLDHDDFDQRQANVPGIMFARGTLVRPQFQWNPASQAGAPGGSVNPRYRHVRAEDIAKLVLNQISFVNGVGCLGQGIPKRVVLMNVIPIETAKARLKITIEQEEVSSPDVSSERAKEADDH